MIYLLNCNGDISTCCSDYGLAKLLSFSQSFIDLIRIIVPIILIVMMVIQFTKLMINPEEKKNLKGIFNMLIATVIIFFLPMIINVVLGILPDVFQL